MRTAIRTAACHAILCTALIACAPQDGRRVDGSGASELAAEEWHGLLTDAVEGTDLRRVSLLGIAVERLGDVNQDGVSDFALGDPTLPGGGTYPRVIEQTQRSIGFRQTRTGFAEVPSRVHLVSGATFRRLATLEGEAPNDGFGTSVQGELDLDGDGVPDFVVGAAGGAGDGYVRAFAGSTLEVLWTARVDRDGIVLRSMISGAGPRLERVPDANGDGRTEVAVVSMQLRPGSEGTGVLTLLSGRDGAVLWTRRPDETVAGMAGGVLSIEDLDGDAIGDLAVGAVNVRHVAGTVGVNAWLEGEPPGAPGQVLLLSGVSGRVLRRIPSPRGAQMFGFHLVQGRDWDGDGSADLLVSEAFESPDTERGAENEVFAISLTTGEVLRTWKRSYDASDVAYGFGCSMLDLGDFLILAFPSRGFGRDGVWLYGAGEPAGYGDGLGWPDHGFGRVVADLGDLDGDRQPEIAIASGSTWKGPECTVYVYSSAALRRYASAPEPPWPPRLWHCTRETLERRVAPSASDSR